MKEYIRQGIRFLEYLFTPPAHWIITAPLYKLIFTWLIFYTFIGIFMTVGGIFCFLSINALFTDQFFSTIMTLLIGGIMFFYGSFLLHSAIYNVYYYMQIMISGEIVNGKIKEVKFNHKKVRGTNLSSYSFLVEYQAPLEQGELYDITHFTSIYKSHFYSDLATEGRIIKVKYWKKNPRKARILWNKS